jgi:hypothetical protein
VKPLSARHCRQRIFLPFVKEQTTRVLSSFSSHSFLRPPLSCNQPVYRRLLILVPSFLPFYHQIVRVPRSLDNVCCRYREVSVNICLPAEMSRDSAAATRPMARTRYLTGLGWSQPLPVHLLGIVPPLCSIALGWIPVPFTTKLEAFNRHRIPSMWSLTFLDLLFWPTRGNGSSRPGLPVLIGIRMTKIRFFVHPPEGIG